MKEKRIKVIHAALVLCFLCVLLSACTTKTVLDDLDRFVGGDAGGPETEGLTAAQQALAMLPQKLIKVGFVQVGHESDWRIAATKSCQEAFSAENGYELYFVDADNDPKVQVEAVRNFIKEQVDYIVIDPILTTGWTAVLKEAYHAHIPVIVLDRTIDCKDKYYTAWFGSDFVREGEWAGEWLQMYLKRQGREFEKIHIVTINGTQGASAQIGRTEGFARYLEKNSNWELLAQECGDFTESGGRAVMEEYLQAYPKIDVVVCQNDNEAFGACAALEEAGVPYGTDAAQDGGIIVISFDATRAGLQAVLDGKIHADFECNPLSPPYAAEAIRRLEAGEVLKEKDYYLPEDCFTADGEPMTLMIDFETKKMVTVTKELLKEREY
ncbi:MAG: ABC transporter substrate-binding protein [Eubacterium sp.]|nr:ABC transporter substrate-binding protein [Eubacterium sp.]